MGFGLLKKKEWWDFPGGPVAKTSPLNAEGEVSIHSWRRTKIPHASWPKNQNIKQKQYCNKVNKDKKERKKDCEAKCLEWDVCVCSTVSDSLRSLWIVAHQAPLSVKIFRQEYWSRLLFPPPGDLPNPGIEPVSLVSPALAGGFFTTALPKM